MSSPVIIRHGSAPGSPGNLNCPGNLLKMYKAVRTKTNDDFALPELNAQAWAMEVFFNQSEVTEVKFFFDSVHPTLPSLLTVTFEYKHGGHMLGAIYHPLDRVLEGFDPSGPSPESIVCLQLLAHRLGCTDVRWGSTYLLQEGEHQDDLCAVYTYVLLLARMYMPWQMWNELLYILRCIGIRKRSFLLKKCYEKLLLKQETSIKELVYAMAREAFAQFEENDRQCVDVVGNVKKHLLVFKETDDDELDQLIPPPLLRSPGGWSPLRRYENVTVRSKKRR